jgi:Golgi nucleoside diphosphatase
MWTNRFNVKEFYILPHCICVFCIYLRTNSDLFHLQHKLIGFYNPDDKCLQRGTDWVFK